MSDVVLDALKDVHAKLANPITEGERKALVEKLGALYVPYAPAAGDQPGYINTKEVRVSPAGDGNQHFATGSQRDTETGKGRFDLLPYDALLFVARVGQPELAERWAIRRGTWDAIADCALEASLSAAMHAWGGDQVQALEELARAAYHGLLFIERRETGTNEIPGSEDPGLAGIPWPALHAVAVLFQEGARKYEARNWEKGQPIARVFSSHLRHGFKMAWRVKDEDHATAYVWNALALIAMGLRGRWDDSLVNPHVPVLPMVEAFRR